MLGEIAARDAVNHRRSALNRGSITAKALQTTPEVL
jgi:hypothetical protein